MPSLLHENRHTLRLALPILTGQLGQMLLGLSDTLMIGRVDQVALAAAGLVNALVHVLLATGIGLAAAVSVRVSHAHGAGNPREASETLRHGLHASLWGGMLILGLLSLSPLLLPHLGQRPEVLAATPPYLRWIAISLLFFLPTMVIKSFAESLNHPWPVFWIQLAGVGLNVLLNALFIFGKAGFPPMGLEGAGIATCLARVATLLALAVYLRASPTLAPNRPERWRAPLSFSFLRSLWSLGAPVTGQLALEIGAFALTAVLMGRLGSQALAANQIAITCAATTFMVPLGISMAVTIRVGHALGAGQSGRALLITRGAHGLGTAFMALCALVYLALGVPIAALFTRDAALAALSARLLAITGVFQVFDGIQIISMGALRGYKDVRVPTLLLLLSYWWVAIPLGVFLGFPMGLGGVGLWSGLAIGLALAALLLTRRLHRIRRHADLQSGD